MKSDFFYVIFVALLLISSAFGQSVTEIAKQLRAVAKECGNSAVGNEAATCVENAVNSFGGAPPESTDELSRAARTLLDCVQPFKELVTKCEKDNYITILEVLRAIGQNDGQILKTVEQVGNNSSSSLCTLEEEIKLNNLTASCMEGFRDYNYDAERFCLWASGLRACFQSAHDNTSPEDCPRIRDQALAYLSVFDKVENSAENPAVVQRCFNATAE